MTQKRKYIAACAAIAIGLAFASAPAPAADTNAGSATVQPDNTKLNLRDRNGAELTADKQGQAKQDRETTRQIRRALMRDKSLSTYAHNVKIITLNGRVTLKGPVRSEQERKSVMDMATSVTGGRPVMDEMSVKPKR